MDQNGQKGFRNDDDGIRNGGCAKRCHEGVVVVKVDWCDGGSESVSGWVRIGS